MQIFIDMRQHVSVRKSEWIIAGLQTHLGLFLLGSSNVFASNPSFSMLASWPFTNPTTNENLWAVIFIVLGLSRVLVLTLNGYTLGLLSAQIRRFLSGISFMILVAFVFGFDASGVATTGAVTYKWLAMAELLNVWQASADLSRRTGKSDSHAAGN
jgi:hypothetical protein